jgi:hypothetical protein
MKCKAPQVRNIFSNYQIRSPCRALAALRACTCSGGCMQQQRRRGCRALREQRVVGAANTRGSGCSIDWGGSESGSVLSQRLRGARVLCLLRRLHPPVTLRQSESVRQKLLHKSVPQLPISPSTHCTPVSGVNFGWSAGDEPPPPPLSPLGAAITCDFVFAAGCLSEFWMPQSPQQ